MDKITTASNNLRDNRGLLLNHIYPINSDGFINWRAMLKPEHLYINPEFEKELKMKFNVKSRRDIDVTQCADHELLVLLDGWRHLLKMRGFISVDTKIDFVNDTKAVATCKIELIPNFETPYVTSWSDTASASLYSVSGNFQLHLEAMAANRAFARAVRSLLGVKIYGKDEYDPKANKEYEEALNQGQNLILESKKTPSVPVVETAPIAITPQENLKKLCDSLSKNGSHSFEKIKKQAHANLTSFSTDPNDWTDWDSIPNKDVWVLLNKINAAQTVQANKA